MSESTVEKLTIGTLSAAATFMLVFTCRLLQSRHTKSSEDPYHRVRYKEKISTEDIVVHVGRCHCQRAQFRIRSTAEINAVDIPSKLRFPRVTVGYEDFEWDHPDQSTLSMYSVQQPDNASSVGIHIFCSNCGMQIVFAPSLDPVEVQVNLDCIDTSTIEKVHVAYHAAIETLPSNEISGNGNMNRFENHQLQSLSHHHNATSYAHQRIPYQQNFSSRSHNTSNIRGKRLVESVLDGAPDSDTTEELFDHFHSPRVTPTATSRRELRRTSLHGHQQFRRHSNSGGEEDDSQVGPNAKATSDVMASATADSDVNSITSSLDFSESDHQLHQGHYHYGYNSPQSSQRSTPRRPNSLPMKSASSSSSPFNGDKFAPETPLDLPMYQNLKLFLNHHMTADERKRESSSSASIAIAT